MPVPQDYNPDFEVGDKVRHFKFGIGQVIDICAAGADYEVTVDFDMPQYGKKKLMAKIKQTQKVIKCCAIYCDYMYNFEID